MTRKLFVASLLLFAINFLSHAQAVKTHGRLTVQGTKLTDEHGSPVVLRGMSYGWHNFWPRFYNAETVKWLHEDWGCSVVRAAMGVEPANGYIEQPEWSKEKVKAVVDG